MAIHKQPPNSRNAEESVLGGLLRRNDAYGDVAQILRAEDFYARDHQLVFSSIGAMLLARRPCDCVTLVDYLRDRKELEEAGGATHIVRLATELYSDTNLIAYAKIVAEHAARRKLIAAGAAIGDLGYNSEGLSSDELLERAERTVFEMRSTRRADGGLRPLSHYAVQAEHQIERLHKSGGGMGGTSTGFHWLNRKLDGLHPGDLIYIGGRPGTGKSTLAMNIAEHVAFRVGKRVDVFSMEMQGMQVAMRTLAGLSRVPMNRLRGGALEQDDWDRIVATSESMHSERIQIDETGSLSPLEMRARARRSAARGDLALIVVDYLQLMRIPGSRENRTNELAAISSSLKSMAKECGVAVVALSQLSRAVDRENRPPKLSDLRDCGGIEADADAVLFIHRENVDEGEEGGNESGVAKLIIGKQRSGPTGSTYLHFHGPWSRFEEMEAGELEHWRDRDRRKVEPLHTGFGRLKDGKRAAAGDA